MKVYIRDGQLVACGPRASEHGVALDQFLTLKMFYSSESFEIVTMTFADIAHQRLQPPNCGCASVEERACTQTTTNRTVDISFEVHEELLYVGPQKNMDIVHA